MTARINNSGVLRAIAFMIIAALALVMTSQASANSRGQCTPSGRVATTTTQFAKNIAGEKVTSQAARVFRSAGYSQADGSVATWLKRDTVVANLASSARVQNYGCKNGKLFGAGRKTLRAGTPVVVSLPAKYGKGGFSLKRTKKFSVRKVVVASFVGQTSCSNPGSGKVRVVIWVAPAPKKVTPKPVPVVPVIPACNAGQTNPTNSGTACQGNASSQTATQTASVSNKCDQTNVNNSEQCNTTIVQVTNQTTIQVNANCSIVTINYSDGRTEVVYKDVNGNVINVCSSQTTTPPPTTPPPPSVKSVKILAQTTLNDIPTGKTSGPVYTTVNASDSGGSVTIDPGIGAISRCDSTVPTDSVTFSSLPAGNSNLCVTLYAPNDPGSRPTEMEVITIATLTGAAPDKKVATFKITYPTRP